MNSKKLPTIDSLFPLPEWARWVAVGELNSQLKIQIASLKYPRWDMSFYPVFFGDQNQQLFPFPKSLDVAANDGRRWSCCPDTVWYSPDFKEIVFEEYNEGDHPRPPHAGRFSVKAPDFLCTLSEGKTGDYDTDGGAIPILTPRSELLKSIQLQPLPGIDFSIFSRAPNRTPTWPQEKAKQKPLSKK